MCRLFGFRSVIPSQVHRSLLDAENALGVQSNDHPDGWGVAFYVDGAPHVTRSPTTALGDALFHRLSGVVSSETVLAHVRKATQGSRTIFNCHPFQFGRWVFAHNGDIPNFETKRELLLAQVSPRFRSFILGETDSEVLFFLFMSVLEEQGSLTGDPDIDSISSALKEAVSRARQWCDNDGTRALLTVVATNGDCLVAAQGGKELYFSTYKTRCSERGTCSSLSAVCEAPSSTGRVNHFIVSSEPLQGENVWEPLAAGDVIGVDGRMHVSRSRLDHGALPVVA
ncbi:MAG: class II glutamine amidotransferase [Polyangiaceae bacterium]